MADNEQAGRARPSPEGDRDTIRRLADEDRPRSADTTEQRAVETVRVRMSQWQQCGGGWRKRAHRHN